MRWRTGRRVGRTIYRQLGPVPSDEDPLIGVMDTPELAGLAVDAVNRWAWLLDAVRGIPGDAESVQDDSVAQTPTPEDPSPQIPAQRPGGDRA